MITMNEYPILEKPPVVVALAQLKFRIPNFKVDNILMYDKLLKNRLPICHGNIRVGLDFGKTTFPLGESKVSGVSNAEIGSYVYISKNQRMKFEVTSDAVTFIDENPYQGWEHFKSETLQLLSIVSPLFSTAEILRLSIRFVNRFTFSEFSDPKVYFNTLISSSDGESSYPLRQYGFRLMMDVPDTDIYTIVNHNVENVPQDKYIYTFDIDVLDRQKLIFDIDTIGENLENLRQIKNKIFFDTITENTKQLCSSQK